METRTLTHDELLAELRERFGDDPMRWAFKCPSCGDVATGQDFRDALAEYTQERIESKATASDRLGQECIGRTLGVLSGPAEKWRGRGCDWAAYGLFRGPWFVTTAEGREIACFPIAEAAAS